MQIASGLPYSDTFDIKAHDEWLMDLWCSTVDEQDTIYILGDLTSRKKERARLLLEKLPGQKYLIEGNHDVALRPFKDSFQDVYQIKLITFKPSVAPFLKENFVVAMCHYPMVTWNQKPKGAIMLHGHCHGNLDEYNNQSTDLRFDVGFDGSLANMHFLTLENIYNAAMEKISKVGCKTFAEYASKHYKPEVR